MLTYLERQELKKLSLELLGNEHLWRKFIKGVRVPLLDLQSNPLKAPNSKVPLLKTITKTEKDTLIYLREQKEKKLKEKQKEIEAATGKISCE